MTQIPFAFQPPSYQLYHIEKEDEQINSIAIVFAMDLVFVNKDHVRSSLVTPEGNIYYHVSIEQPSIESSPVTRVEATRESLPLLPVSRKEFKRIPKSRDEVASIRWKDGAGNGASLHCKALDEGVCAKGFMRKKHALKL